MISLLEVLDIDMEIGEVVILLVLAVVSSLATRMVYEQMNLQSKEGFADETAKIPIQNILKHIQMNSAIVPKSDSQYWEAADEPMEAIHLKQLPGGVVFKTLRIENVGGYTPGIVLCDSPNCHISGQSWGVYMPPKKMTEASVDYVHHQNGYIATDDKTRKQIQREFAEPGLSVSEATNRVKVYPPVIETAPQQNLPVAPVSLPSLPKLQTQSQQTPKCPVEGEVRLWNGACMSQSRMENEFKYWTSPNKVSEYKRKGQYYSNVVPSLRRLNESYQKVTGKQYPIPA